MLSSILSFRFSSGSFRSHLPAFLAFVLAGCGSMGTPIMPPPPPTPTSVALLLTSTANDQFTEFNIDIASFTLTNKAGASVSLIPATQNNGIYQPRMWTLST